MKKMTVTKSSMPKKSSSVIKPGTGSGSRPTGGSTKTPMSAPVDKQGLGRKPPGALK